MDKIKVTLVSAAVISECCSQQASDRRNWAGLGYLAVLAVDSLRLDATGWHAPKATEWEWQAVRGQSTKA